MVRGLCRHIVVLGPNVPFVSITKLATTSFTYMGTEADGIFWGVKISTPLKNNDQDLQKSLKPNPVTFPLA